MISAFGTFLLARVSRGMFLLPLLIGLGAWASADDGRSLTLRVFLLATLPLIPAGLATSAVRTPAIQLERTLPIHLQLFEFGFIIGWSSISCLAAVLAFALPERDTLVVDRIVALDWAGNILASTGLALGWLRFFPARLAWMPGSMWMAGALAGALPALKFNGLIPAGFWWWPVAELTDTESQWTKGFLFIGGSILYMTPRLHLHGMRRRFVAERD